MHASLRAFMEGIIDYAGLFPPAKLPLDDAIRNYAQYREQPEAWMLGRFICPAHRLSQLVPYHEEFFTVGAPFSFAVLGSGGEDMGSFIERLAEDLIAIESFRTLHGDRVSVDVYETRLPEYILNPLDLNRLNGFLARATKLMDDHGLADAIRYFEGMPSSTHAGEIRDLIETMARHDLTGYKLRCGGVTADAFPSPEIVATTIAACREHSVAFKATAGLHHPVRRYDDGVEATMHGFLNVFGAALLAFGSDNDADTLREIIEDTDASNFVFDGLGFAWRRLAIGIPEILDARRTMVTSFGSCSFDEPRADLRALGLLDGS